MHRCGQGPPLVLLHGIGHRWQAWRPVLAQLAEHHEVFALDLPGFGESQLPSDGMPLDMASTVARFRLLFAQWGVERPHVAGNSLGGAIALELAVAGLVASVTAIAPAGFYTRAERRRAVTILSSLRAQTLLPEPVLRAAIAVRPVRLANFGTLVVHPDRLERERMLGDALAMRRGKAFRPTLRASRAYRFTGGPQLAAQPQLPLTVAWGERDRVLPPRQAERARAQLPHARHVLLPGCGHVPMSDAPGLVSREILTTTGRLT